MTETKMPVAFHIMLKPSGPACNLNCAYCFYLDKRYLYPDTTLFRMSDEVLEEFTKQYITSQEVPEINFAWQGGEPTLMGLDFFERAVSLQRKYLPPRTRIFNSFQTNGILIDENWCKFLRDNNFLVGLSLDGPAQLHNANRMDKGEKTTFDKVLNALKLMQEHNVEFNVLCVVNSVNAKCPVEVYKFFKQQGVKFIQFIPAVYQKSDGTVTDWTVRPLQYGKFLCDIFDEWVKKDVGEIFVQIFDVALGSWLGMEPNLCVFAKSCGKALAMEHNGDLYSCDHFVFKENLLGNILKTSVKELVYSDFQKKFGTDKYDALPEYCKKCSVCFVCNGACPKDRFRKTPDGEAGLNYLCDGYKQFFTHIDKPMQIMADELKAGRLAANVMHLYNYSV
ncbi:MAG: anaerobic sulfatase maturase [Candidatus Firestonebacteria bacterium]